MTTKYAIKGAELFLSLHLLKLCRKKDDLVLKGTSLLSNLPILLVRPKKNPGGTNTHEREEEGGEPHLETALQSSLGNHITRLRSSVKNAEGIGRQFFCTIGAKTRHLDSKARVLAHHDDCSDRFLASRRNPGLGIPRTGIEKSRSPSNVMAIVYLCAGKDQETLGASSFYYRGSLRRSACHPVRPLNLVGGSGCSFQSDCLLGRCQLCSWHRTGDLHRLFKD